MKKRNLWVSILAGLMAAVMLLAVACLFAGSSNMSIADALDALAGKGTPANVRIIWKIRVPRVLAAIIAGAGEGLDVVIGSIHNYREELGGLEFYADCFDCYEKCHIALNDYLTSMEELVALPDCYDILGHINYPLRYMRRDGHSVFCSTQHRRVPYGKLHGQARLRIGCVHD